MKDFIQKQDWHTGPPGQFTAAECNSIMLELKNTIKDSKQEFNDDDTKGLKDNSEDIEKLNQLTKAIKMISHDNRFIILTADQNEMHLKHNEHDDFIPNSVDYKGYFTFNLEKPLRVKKLTFKSKKDNSFNVDYVNEFDYLYNGDLCKFIISNNNKVVITNLNSLIKKVNSKNIYLNSFNDFKDLNLSFKSDSKLIFKDDFKPNSNTYTFTNFILDDVITKDVNVTINKIQDLNDIKNSSPLIFNDHSFFNSENDHLLYMDTFNKINYDNYNFKVFRNPYSKVRIAEILNLILFGKFKLTNENLNKYIRNNNLLINEKVENINSSLNRKISNVDSTLDHKISDVSFTLNTKIDDLKSKHFSIQNQILRFSDKKWYNVNDPSIDIIFKNDIYLSEIGRGSKEYNISKAISPGDGVYEFDAIYLSLDYRCFYFEIRLIYGLFEILMSSYVIDITNPINFWLILKTLNTNRKVASRFNIEYMKPLLLDMLPSKVDNNSNFKKPVYFDYINELHKLNKSYTKLEVDNAINFTYYYNHIYLQNSLTTKRPDILIKEYIH